MTKFKNRKGLALGSIFALVISGFVGVMPAKAAIGDIVLEPAYGSSTNFTSLQGDYGMVLATSYKSAATSSDALRYLVTVTTTDLNINEVTVSASITTSGTVNKAYKPTRTAAETLGAFRATSSGVASTTAWVFTPPEGYFASNSARAFSHVWFQANRVTGLITSDNTGSVTVTVQAWEDTILNGEIDLAEDVLSSPVTLTFVDGALFTPSVALTQPVLGQRTVSATVELDGLNKGNFFNTATTPGVRFARAVNATETDIVTTSASGVVPVTYDSEDDVLEASTTSSAVILPVEAGTYAAALYIDGSSAANNTAGEFATNDAEWTNTKTVGALQVNNFAITAVTGATIAQDTGLTGDNRIVALAETKTIPFSIQGWADVTKSVAIGANVTATITLTDNGLGTTTLTAGSKTLKAEGVNSITFNVNSDANGIWSFDVVADRGLAGHSFTISATAQGVAAAAAKTVTWQAETVSLLEAPAISAIKIANGGSVDVMYMITNQFGRVPAGEYQVNVTRTRDSGRTTVSERADFAYNVAFGSDGKATVKITDNGSATVEGADVITAQLQKKAASGGAFGNVAGASQTFTLTYETDLKTAALSTTVNNNGSKRGTVNVKALALEDEELRNFDSRVDSTAALEFEASNAYNSTTATTPTELVAITGHVRTSAGTGITGVPVVVSGAGLMFSDGASGTATTVRHSLDSMVLVTGTGGAYTFYVRGNLSGAKNVTVTAAGVTNTVTLTFAAGSTNAANMAITVPATSNPGKVVDVVVKLTDAKGNPASGVDVTFKSRGVGYLNALSGTSDADGEVIVKLITLTNDSGTATITATATLAGVSTAKSATVTVGTAPAEVNAVIGSFQGRWAVRVENAKGSTVTVRVGGNWVKYTALNDNYLFSRASRVGATVAVSVWVDGELQNSQTITVK